MTTNTHGVYKDGQLITKTKPLTTSAIVMTNGARNMGCLWDPKSDVRVIQTYVSDEIVHIETKISLPSL